MEQFSEKPPRIAELLSPLIRRGVDFVLVGGMGGIIHGSSLPSFDVDVAYARDRTNLERLAEALRELDVRLRGAPPDVPFIVDAQTLENGANFTFSTPLGDLDILGDISGVRSYDDLRSRAIAQEAYGLRIFVASIEDLIAMKRAANRPKDRLMLEEYIVLAEEKARLAQKQQSERTKQQN